MHGLRRPQRDQLPCGGPRGLGPNPKSIPGGVRFPFLTDRATILIMAVYPTKGGVGSRKAGQTSPSVRIRVTVFVEDSKASAAANFGVSELDEAQDESWPTCWL